jgi:hypothetical protein
MIAPRTNNDLAVAPRARVLPSVLLLLKVDAGDVDVEETLRDC